MRNGQVAAVLAVVAVGPVVGIKVVRMMRRIATFAMFGALGPRRQGGLSNRTSSSRMAVLQSVESPTEKDCR